MSPVPAVLAIAILLFSSRVIAAPPVPENEGPSGDAGGHEADETIEVRAPRSQELAARPSALVTVVSVDERDEGVIAIPQLLQEAPSTRLQEFGGLGHLATMALRGASPSQTKILLDGMPLPSPTGGGVDLSFLPAELLEKVEVLRGAESILFGSGAMGGVVNLVTRSPGSGQLWAKLSGGSFGSYLASIGAGFATARTDFLAAASALETAGDYPYHDNRDTPNNPADDQDLARRNNWARSAGFLFKWLSRLPGGATLAFAQEITAQERGVAGVLDFKALYASESSWLGSFNGCASAPVGNGLVEAGVHLLANGHHLVDTKAELTGVPLNERQEMANPGVYVQAAILWRGVHQFRMRAEFDQLSLRDPAFHNPVRRSIGLGTSADFSLAQDRIALGPAVRLGFDSDAGWQVAPGLGVAWKIIPGLDLKANVSRSYRVPDFSELYLQGGFVEGNPDLRPESAWGADLGVAWSPAPAWSLSLAGFYQRSSDLIVFEIEGAFRYKPQNVGEAEVGGLELELRIPFSPDITASAHYTLLLSFDRSGRPNLDGNWLPGWPQHSGGVRVWGSWRSLLFEGEATYVGSNFVNGANTKEIPQRLLFDAGIGIKAGAGLRLMVQGRNLTNAQTEDVRGFPLPGISFFLTASWQQGEKT